MLIRLRIGGEYNMLERKDQLTGSSFVNANAIMS